MQKANIKIHNKSIQFSKRSTRNTFGVDSDEETPDPIPNSAVKLISGDGTVRATVWESSTMPVLWAELGKPSSAHFFCLFEISRNQSLIIKVSLECAVFV